MRIPSVISCSRAAAALLAACTATLSAQTVVADYPLLTDLLDANAAYLPVTLTGNPTPPAPPNNGVCHNGIYDFAATGGQDIRTDTLVSLDPTDFQLEIDFNLTALPTTFNRPIIMGGNGWRWIGLYVDTSGQIGVIYNNSLYHWSTTTVTAGTWNSAIIKVDSGFVELFLNGNLILFEQVGVLNHAGDLDFTTNNYSNGTALDGCIRNLKFTNDTTLVSKVPPQIIGVIESVPYSGTLSADGGSFTGGTDFLRWNFNDTSGNFPNALVWTIVNFGVGGPPPVGVTPGIQGFDQLSNLSTPMGQADIFSPTQIGAPDTLLFIPPGLFGIADSVRMQGLVLDPGSPNAFPVVATRNTVLFSEGLSTCVHTEDFEATALGVGSYPSGWASGGGIYDWTAQSGGTPSGGTGPSSGALGGSVYMFCETSSPAVAGDQYIMNTSSYSLAGVTTVGFSLSRVGATVGTLEVRMDDGTGAYATVLGTYAGPEPGGREWVFESLTIPAGAPASASFQFRYICGSSFTGDLAIDNFCLR